MCVTIFFLKMCVIHFVVNLCNYYLIMCIMHLDNVCRSFSGVMCVIPFEDNVCGIFFIAPDNVRNVFFDNVCPSSFVANVCNPFFWDNMCNVCLGIMCVITKQTNNVCQSSPPIICLLPFWDLVW